MFENVKQEIDDKIKTNGNNEITATRLNGVLQDMMDASAEVIEEVQRSIGDQVEANPTEAATDSLEKIKIGEKVYNIPDPDTSNFVTNQELQQELSGYVQKTDPPSPAADDLVAFDQYGGFGSSGKKVTDFATAEQGAKADTAVQPSALNNYVQKSQTTGLLKNDGTVDTQTVGKAASALQPISGATENNFAAFDANGSIKDSGNKSADFATAAQGAKADTAVQQVTVGTTTTGAAGSNASVTNSGTSTAPVLDFTIPRGADAVNPFKGWFDANITGEAGSKVVDDTANLPESPTVGDYAYVKTLDITGVAPTQTETPVVKIYECTNAGSWSDSGRTADTSNVQTFASSQEVNEVHIVNDLATGGVDDVLSAEQGKVIGNKLSDVSIDGVSDENDEIIIKDEQGNQVAKVNDEGIDAIGLKINGVTVNAGTMLSGKKIALFGDSIMQLRDNSGNGVPEYIATITGATVYRCSVGGLMLARRLSTLTPVESATYANQLINYLDFGHSFRKVATPVATRDLTDVNAAWSKLKTDYQQLDSADITTAMDNWNNIDFENIDIVIMSAGTNDTRYITLGNDDSEDEITINGSVNAAVKTLLTNFPHISFYIFTPTVHYIEGTWSDDYTANDPGMNQLKPEELYMGIAAAAKRNHIPVKDMYNGMGWTRYNFSHYCHQNDGIHPYEGFKNMAMAMSSFIIANETFK